MFKVNLTIDTLDAASPEEAVDMFLNAIITGTQLQFETLNNEGRTALITTRYAGAYKDSAVTES